MGMIEAFARGWVNARERHASDVASAAPAVGDHADQTASLADELDACRLRIADLTNAVEALTTRAELFAAVLRLPGARIFLVKLTHPDRHPNAPETDRREFADAAAKVNAAYEILDEP
jgi:hypothetical protein